MVRLADYELGSVNGSNEQSAGRRHADRERQRLPRVTAIVRLPRIAEFVDEPLYGVLEVEPLEVEPL